MKEGMLSFEPKIPEQWNGYSFKINFRNRILKIKVAQDHINFEMEGNQALKILVNGKQVTIEPNHLVTV